MALIIPGLMEIPVVTVTAVAFARIGIAALGMPAIAIAVANHTGRGCPSGGNQGAGTHKQSNSGGRNGRFLLNHVGKSDERWSCAVSTVSSVLFHAYRDFGN